MLLNTGDAVREQEIFDRLIPMVQEVTGARKDQITMNSGLMKDLGAESVDLLDFSFLIEEHFGITIEANEFEQQISQKLNAKPYETNGMLSEEALDQLKIALPEVPEGTFKPGLKKIELPSVLTVAVFVHLIQRKLRGKSEESCRAQG
jgi:acyl carrier protein